MKRILYCAICIAMALAAAAPLFASEVLDAVVATVNHKPILRSDWDEAVCFEAFMQQKPLDKVTESDRVLALHRLIDRQLLKAQMGDAGYMQPSADQLEQDVAKLRAQVPNGKDDASWRELLAKYDLSEAVVKEHLRTEFQVMNFLEVRLRPNVHISDDEIDSYYNAQVLPDLQTNGDKPLPLAELEPRIRELLTQQEMDELLNAWLHNLRQQAEIYSSVAIPGINAPAETPRASGSD